MNFKNRKYQIVLSFILGIFISIVVFLLYNLFLMPYYQNRYQEKLIKSDSYQAVFFEGDQIYFGRLRKINSQYPILDDVHYVKLEGESATSGRLVRLGETEPHGPYNQMILNRDHILFWENLKPDSPIVQAILNLKLNQ